MTTFRISVEKTPQQHLHLHLHTHVHTLNRQLDILIFALSITTLFFPRLTYETGLKSNFHQYTIAFSSQGSKHMEALGQRAQRKRNMDRDGLQELRGGVERLGAWYSNRFRCLTLTASQLDSQCCLLAKDRGWERGREGEEAIQRRGTEEKDGSMQKKKNELKNKLIYDTGGREGYIETEWVNISLHHSDGFLVCECYIL